jgi:hypothetical protein
MCPRSRFLVSLSKPLTNASVVWLKAMCTLACGNAVGEEQHAIVFGQRPNSHANTFPVIGEYGRWPKNFPNGWQPAVALRLPQASPLSFVM